MPNGLALLALATVVCAFAAASAIAWHPPVSSDPARLTACRGTCPSDRTAAVRERRSDLTPTTTSLSTSDGWTSEPDGWTPEPDRWASGTLGVAVAPTPTPHAKRTSSTTAPVKKRTHRLLSGIATWHATGRDGAYAAAGPLLREALGRGWRGTRVLVCSGGRCVRVTLNDVCWCPKGRRLVDLSDEAFARLASLSRGVIAIDIRR